MTQQKDVTSDVISIRPNSRRGGGFSLRRGLFEQGVTDEDATRNHLSFVYNALSRQPSLDITLYRVNPNYPNGAVPSDRA